MSNNLTLVDVNNIDIYNGLISKKWVYDMIGKKLKTLREGKGLTQLEVAEFLGVSRTTYTQYETERSEPDLVTVSKLSDYFEVSLDYLVGRTNIRGYPHTQAAHIDEEGPPVTEDVLNQIEEIIKREREKIRREREGK